MIYVLLGKFSADAENGDVEEVGFDEFQKLARGEGHIVYGEFAAVDVFLQDCGDQVFACSGG